MCLQYKADGGRGVLGWVLLIGGILVGGFIALGVIGFFITKAQQRAHPPAQPGLMPAGMQLPVGMQPPGGVSA